MLGAHATPTSYVIGTKTAMIRLIKLPKGKSYSHIPCACVWAKRFFPLRALTTFQHHSLSKGSD
jgi:hypothetical protein